MLFINKSELFRSRSWVCFYFGFTANLCRPSLTLYHDILWLILLFVFVSRVILHGVLAWYSYLFWLILTPCQLLFSLRIRNLDPAILMSTLWIIMISHKSDSHGLTPLGSILWCKWNCDMLIIYLLSMLYMENIWKRNKQKNARLQSREPLIYTLTLPCYFNDFLQLQRYPNPPGSVRTHISYRHGSKW